MFTVHDITNNATISTHDTLLDAVRHDFENLRGPAGPLTEIRENGKRVHEGDAYNAVAELSLRQTTVR